MSNYDFREQPAYSNFKSYINPEYNSWWSDKHDELVKKLMKEYRWNWAWKFSENLHQATDEITMLIVKSDKNWYNKVMNHAATRCHYFGHTYIEPPVTKECRLCNNQFTEDSLPLPLMERLGAYNLDYCAPCLRDTVLQNSGNNELSNTEIIKFIKSLSGALELIPPQGFGESKLDFTELTPEKTFEILKILQNKPSYKLIRERFGSWLKALIAAELLIDGTRETSRGIQTFAKDGHLCLSLGEKTIDDYLYSRNIPHLREIYYPGTRYRTDFVVDNIFIEYFGLAGNKDYDIKSQEKRKICNQHNILLIELYPKDLITIEKLEKKLEPLQQFSLKT